MFYNFVAMLRFIVYTLGIILLYRFIVNFLWPMLRITRTASQRIRELYEATSAQDVHNRATHLLIDYLVVAPAERAKYPALEAALDLAPELFRRVFHNGTASIYQLQKR